MTENSSNANSRYFTELALRLKAAGFSVQPPDEDGRMTVEWKGQPLCHVNRSGNILYHSEDMHLPEIEAAKDQVIGIASTTAEYMRLMEQATQLKASGLEGDYRILADFNNTVLAAHPTRYGVTFVTWDWDFDRRGLSHGHYFEGGYQEAKQDFAVRCGLVPRDALLSQKRMEPSQSMEMGECKVEHINKKWLEFLREQYPKGSRIRLREMKDPYHPVPPGMMGTLDYIDDIGTFHVKWDNGSGLGLVIGEDSFAVYPPEETTFKLYMPLTADLYRRDSAGTVSKKSSPLNSSALANYVRGIAKALQDQQIPEEAERGLMFWYEEDDFVSDKVQSVRLTAEVRDGILWGVAECCTKGSLTAEEQKTLMTFLEKQVSGDWGWHFEQREIRVDEGTLHVHLWNDEGWKIQTEEACFTDKRQHQAVQLGGMQLG